MKKLMLLVGLGVPNASPRERATECSPGASPRCEPNPVPPVSPRERAFEFRLG